MTLYLGASSAMFICVRREVVLMYFIVKERIKALRLKWKPLIG
jgi:hypothetical protein